MPLGLLAGVEISTVAAVGCTRHPAEVRLGRGAERRRAGVAFLGCVVSYFRICADEKAAASPP